ncbi:MAG TPA: SDR family NAD(P)-dependent oxidoreductase [Ktedonobacteraceae bacterium]
MLSELDLTGRVAIVTGGAQGIGEAIVKVLHEQGAIVIILDYKEETAVKAAKSTDCSYVLADVKNKQQVMEAVQKVQEEHTRIDLLVNGAGITRDKSFKKMTDEMWHEVIDTNLTGVYNLCKTVWPIMSAQKFGRIVNISSVVALMGNFGQANYCAAKAGLLGLTKDLAAEGARENILVNAVCPGFIDTPMTQAMTPGAREAMKARIPLGHLGDPRDVALAVFGLLTNKYKTGTVDYVNGGLYM